MRSLGMKLVAFAAVAMLTAPVIAQTDTSGAKADVAFEITPSKIISSPLGKKMDFETQIAAMPPGGPDISKIERVFAGVIAPESAEKLEGIQQGGENDMQFFMRVEFSTAEAASKMLAESNKAEGGEVEKNGKTYYPTPEGAGMPKGTMMYLANDKTVAIASGGFIDKTDGAPVTDALATAWKAMPNSAIKLSIDGVNARSLVESIVKAGKKNGGGNPILDAVMDLFPTMDNINLSIDLASADLITLNMTSSDEDKAGDINDGFKSLVTMAKPIAKQGLSMLQAQAPGPAATFGKLVDGMDVKQTGKNVTMNIPRPEGFEDAVQEFVPMAQQLIFQMMMGGFGGPEAN